MGSSSASLPHVLFSLTLFFVILPPPTHASTVRGVDIGNPVIDVIPSFPNRRLPSPSSKDFLYCERVKVSGRSRLEVRSYANSFRVTLAPSAVIPERLHSKIQVCFHRNASLGLCHCEKDEWKSIQKGLWRSIMSPYEGRYVDVKFISEISGSVSISVEEDFQKWRLLCLAVGFLLLLLAPIVSSWVPFYYSTSMAIGVFLLVIILLFQGMKLLPTGRKNFFYLSIYGSVLGAGTFVLHHISVVVNSILINFGLSEEMHNPVYVFVLVGIVLAGAALGYWIVRKFVISKDGSVDVGVAQFVKWATRIIATTFILQSTLDAPLAMVSLVSLYTICFLINALRWRHPVHESYSRGGKAITEHKRAEFLSRSAKMSSGGKIWSSPKSSSAWSNSPVKGVDIGNPVIDVIPSFPNRRLPSPSSKDFLYCERVKVSGRSRLEVRSYANSFRVTLAPSAVIPERLHSKIQVCFHRNASLGLCHCEKDEWKSIQKGLWRSIMSPYEGRYVDVKFISEISGSVSISVEEDFQKWRLLCLAVGFLLLLLAPIVSSWVPFYYSTSMAIGVFLLVIILLFQGMKLLPTGRKNFFYLSIYGSVLGAGTFVLHHISVLVNSILINFGLSEEMHNPVYVFVLVGIVLAGAALGYWIVRKFVISKDGSVDVGVAQFVKWAMRIIATTFILQSTLDAPLAMVSLVSLYTICFLINALRWRHPVHESYSRGGKAITKHKRAEFLSRSAKMSSGGKIWSSPKSSSAWSNSPVKGTRDEQVYFSTFHKTPKRKKFTRKEWEDFTRESTQQAVAEWASSPEVATWIIENADRIQLLASDCSSEETVGSESDSTNETVDGSGKLFSLFNW
ncbi:uncharacterized protein LOC110655736 isoform X3 [Hevea brasiliensis]|uniref:uncharacterized protein LOC110655736 isoform X3 n=1 Tax=Hevea brasiliensis TaxID=3981 RepID=UPI0025EC0677|nr:uncharacterized protein LOC110655736 isoform X3 [Hevea brasiliensis]